MKRLIPILILVACMSLSFGAAGKKRVAVLDFDFASVQRWWESNWDIGAGISDLIVKNLVKDGTYSVIERRALDAVLAEQNFSNSERANPSSAAQIGKMLGVDAIIVGSITQFGTEQKKVGVGGMFGKIGGFGAGKVGTQKGKAVVVVDARIVDINTGEVLAVAEGKGESSRSGLLLGGGGGGGGGYGGGSIDMGSSDYRETILGEATHMATEMVTTELVAGNDRIPTREVSVKGLVAYAEAGLIILNVGSDAGVTVGMELSVERVKQTVKDPATGKILREITEKVATIRVTKADASSAEAALVSGSGISVGDVVKN